MNERNYFYSLTNLGENRENFLRGKETGSENDLGTKHCIKIVKNCRGLQF